MINNINDLETIEQVIREKIVDFDNWVLQHMSFDILKSLYEKYNSDLDAVGLAEKDFQRAIQSN